MHIVLLNKVETPPCFEVYSAGGTFCVHYRSGCVYRTGTGADLEVNSSSISAICQQLLSFGCVCAAQHAHAERSVALQCNWHCEAVCFLPRFAWCVTWPSQCCTT